MKKAIAAIIAITLICVSMLTTSALDRLTVTGQGTISVPADTVTVCFSVDVKAASAKDVTKKSEAVGEAVTSAAERHGAVCEESYFLYEDSESGKWSVSRSYLLVSDQPSNIDNICTQLISSGATAICYIGYSLKNAVEYEEKALSAAIDDARSRAVAIGNTLGEREVIDHGGCACICSEDPDRCGYVMVQCSVEIVYY